jgi:hypothetical protein
MDTGYFDFARGAVANGAADATLVAAPGAGKKIRIVGGTISVTVAGTGGTAIVALEDGLNGTKIFPVSADAVGVFQFFFGPLGYPLTANTLLNLTCDGAATTQASATATLCYKIL